GAVVNRQDAEPGEDAVLGVEPALSRCPLASLAVRATCPGLVPALGEERRERQRLPPSRRVDVAAERIPDDLGKAHVRAGRARWLVARTGGELSPDGRRSS